MKFRILAGFILLIFVSCSIQAEVLVFDATSRGWIQVDGSTNSPGPLANYKVGDYYTHVQSGRFRNYFEFLPIFNGTVVSARLTLDTPDFKSHDATETYQVTSRPEVFGYEDLGTGTVYGSRVYSISDYYQRLSIELNEAALTALKSGQVFRIGGQVTTLSDEFPYQSEIIFLNTSFPNVAWLEITTSSWPTNEDADTWGIPTLSKLRLLLLGACLLLTGWLALRNSGS
jgi:hypothetical protein